MQKVIICCSISMLLACQARSEQLPQIRAADKAAPSIVSIRSSSHAYKQGVMAAREHVKNDPNDPRLRLFGVPAASKLDDTEAIPTVEYSSLASDEARLQVLGWNDFMKSHVEKKYGSQVWTRLGWEPKGLDPAMQ